MPRVFIGGKFIGGGNSLRHSTNALGHNRVLGTISPVHGLVMVLMLTAGLIMPHKVFTWCR